MKKKRASREAANSPSRTGAAAAQTADEYAKIDGPYAKPTAESPRARTFARWRSAYTLLPVLLALAASINTLWNGFASDDHQQVLNNQFIKDLGNLSQAFTTSVWGFGTNDIKFALDSFYRPVFNMLFSVNYALFGASAWGWHLVNILIHAAVTAFVFLALKELTGGRWLALMTALLFAVHPVHAESVAWISGVTDPLMAVFLLPAFYLYLLYRNRGSKYFLGASLVLYLLALLSKETAIMLPLLIAYCELEHFREPQAARPFKGAALMAGLFAAPVLVYMVMRYNALSSLIFGGDAYYSVGSILKTVPSILIKYVTLMAVPVGYSYQHDTAIVHSVASLRFLVPLIILIALAAAVVISRSRVLKFSAVWFIVWLLPALAILRQQDQEYFAQERYLYIPSIGFCLAVALAIEWLAARKGFSPSGAKAATAVLAVLVIALGAALVRQNRVWHNNITLYQNSASVYPRLPLARTSLATSYYEVGRPQEAEQQARIGIEIDPGYLNTYMGLSSMAVRSGHIPQAIEHLERGIAQAQEGSTTRNQLATAYLNLGMLYGQLKQADKAEANLLRSTEIWPRPTAWYYTAQFYFNQKRFEEALSMLEKVRQTVPRSFPQIYIDIAIVYEQLNDKERARAAYEQYLEVTPSSAIERSEVVRRMSQL